MNSVITNFKANTQELIFPDCYKKILLKNIFLAFDKNFLYYCDIILISN